MSFSRSLRPATRLTSALHLTRPVARTILPLATHHNLEFQAPRRTFTCTLRSKMPETNNSDLVLGNLFDVKGKVSRQCIPKLAPFDGKYIIIHSKNHG